MSRTHSIVSFRNSAEFAYQAAMQNLRDGNQFDALQLLRQAVSLKPENAQFTLSLARLYSDLRMYERSDRLLLQLEAAGESSDALWMELALSRLRRGDPEGAYRLLLNCTQDLDQTDDPERYERLLSEIGSASAYAFPRSRRQERCQRLQEKVYEALKEERLHTALLLARHATDICPNDPEAHALQATVLTVVGLICDAYLEAELVLSCYVPPSAHALGIIAHVFSLLGTSDRAEALLTDRMNIETDPDELTVLAQTFAQLGSYEKVCECTRRALHHRPCDTQLLHIRAVALRHLHPDTDDAATCWALSLRIDPEDAVAEYCLRQDRSFLPGYEYELPQEELEHRRAMLANATSGGLQSALSAWDTDPEFVRVVYWARSCSETDMRRVAWIILAAVDTPETRTMLRTALFRRDITGTLRTQILGAARLSGSDLSFLHYPGDDDRTDPAWADRFWVGEKQLLRFADDCLTYTYELSDMRMLAEIWQRYRARQRSRFDVLTNSEAAAAALSGYCLEQNGRDTDPDDLCNTFGAGKRRLNYYSRRLRHVLNAQTDRRNKK